MALNGTTHVHFQYMTNVAPASGWLSYSISGDRFVWDGALVDAKFILAGVSSIFIHLHISRDLEADFDGMPISMQPMRIVSCTIVEYITAELKSYAAAIAVSLFVRGDEPRVDTDAATMHQVGW